MKIRFLNNLSIFQKLFGGFMVATLITAVVSGVGYRIISSNVSTLNELISVDVRFLKDADALSVMALQHRRYEKDFLLNIGNPDKQNSYVKKFKKVSAKTTEKIKTMAAYIETDAHLAKEVKKDLSDASLAYNKYLSGFFGLVTTVQADETITPQKGNKLLKPFKSYIYTFETNVKELAEAGIEIINQSSQTAIGRGKASRTTILALLIIGICMSALMGILITRAIIGAIRKAGVFAENMANGDFTHSLDIEQNDEIGQFAKSLNKMGEQLKKMIANVIQGVETLTSASTELSAISEQMFSNAEETSGKSSQVATASEQMSANMNSVAAASEQASTNVQVVAAAAEQMSSTINEIASNTEKGRAITGDAVDQAKNVSAGVAELGKSANDVGKVTETINDISEQTNLLALNATIEAARAGEAGKGFAVVANEIKELAKQTATATQDIRSKIEGIQRSTSGTVGEINQIETVITDINEIVGTIATSVEEQLVSTTEITSSVNQAAQGIQDVNENVAQSSTVSASIANDVLEVDQAATEMADRSIQVKASAGELSKLSENLKQMVERFKI